MSGKVGQFQQACIVKSETIAKHHFLRPCSMQAWSSLRLRPLFAFMISALCVPVMLP